jgi:aspartate carbamoyltransferase catalytic subunit
MKSDLYVVRHPAAGAPLQLTRWTDAAIVNAGDGRRAHPTQALLDAYTFKTSFPGFAGFEGVKLAIVGDVAHSRVARSNVELWTKLGAQVTPVRPAHAAPRRAGRAAPASPSRTASRRRSRAPTRSWRCGCSTSAWPAACCPSLAEYRQRYQVTRARMRLAHPDALVMHPGPMNRDVEIEGVLADDPRSVIERQVANGVPVRMAVLYTLLVGSR